jgi:hypothetical protein
MSHFSESTADQLLVDFTCIFRRCLCAAERLVEESPAAKVILCLRDPIERSAIAAGHKREPLNLTFHKIRSGLQGLGLGSAVSSLERTEQLLKLDLSSWRRTGEGIETR